MKFYGKTRKGLYAEAEFTGDRIIVLAGSIINMHPTYDRYPKSIIARYRNDRKYVDELGNVLKNCEFKKASTAAAFVTGWSINGTKFWKNTSGKTLKEYLEEKRDEI